MTATASATRNGTQTYPATTRWRFETRYGHDRTTPLGLYWEANCDPVSDDYTPEDMTADELLAYWIKYLDKHGAWSKRLGKPWVTISWYVTGEALFEFAPVAYNHAQDYEGYDGTGIWVQNFLSFYSWPVNATTDESLNWHRLPVEDKLWSMRQANKGGFIQEATGWKPSAFQAYLNTETLVAGIR